MQTKYVTMMSIEWRKLAFAEDWLVSNFDLIYCGAVESPSISLCSQNSETLEDL